MRNKVNKKNVIITISVLVFIFLVVFIAIFVNNTKNSYNFSEKQWINSNSNSKIDVSVKSDLAMFSRSGEGVFYKYLDDLSNDTSLSFNVVSDAKADISFDVKTDLKKDDIVFYTDEFVIVSPSNNVITSLDDISGSNIGVLSGDLSYISSYLSDRSGLTFTSYNSIESMMEALNDSIIYAIIPENLYMDEILTHSMNIVYHMEDLNSYYVLRFESDSKLNSIMKKFFARWSKNKLETVYNEEFLELYYKSKNISELEKENVTKNDIIVGYISNLPYEGVINRTFYGVTNQYLEEFASLTGASYKFVEYSSLKKLKKAINNKKVDVVLNIYGLTSDQYSNSTSLGGINYVVLSHKKSDLYLNSINGLKNREVVMVGENNLYDAFKDNDIFKVKMYTSFKSLYRNIDDDSIIILPSVFYEYYKTTKLEDYTIRYSGQSKAYNTFLMNNNNTAFNNLFNFYLTTRSKNKIELKAINISLEKVNGNLFLAFILKNIIYFIALGCALLFVLYKLNRKVKITKKIKKEDKMMYLDIMTNLKNRNYLNENIQYWNSNKIYPQSIICIDLRCIKSINDKKGHEEGDKQIKAAANILIKTQRENSEIIRTDGDEFLIYLVGYDEKQIITYMHKLNKEFKELPYPYGVALGYSMILSDEVTIDDAINDALQMTNENKGEEIETKE